MEHPGGNSLFQWQQRAGQNLNVIVKKFADLRGESPEYVRELVLNNTKRIFKLFPKLGED